MIEIRLLVIPNAFKRQADDSDHHMVRVEGKFRRPVGLKGDDTDGCFYILFYFYITSSMHSLPLVPRQTWRLTGCYERAR